MKNYLILAAVLIQSSASIAYFNKNYEPSFIKIYGNTSEKDLIRTFSAGGERKDILKPALIASGALEQKILRKHVTVLNRTIKGIITKHSGEKNNYLKCKAILGSLHDRLFRKYRSTRTTILDILRRGEFNCVSSAFLYNLVLSRLGFQTRAVLIPGHVYSQVFINKRWIDVETTLRKGFDPIRRDGVPAIPDDRQFIPEKGDRTKRKFISNIKFIALFYYNRATIQFINSNSAIPFSLLYKALKLFPEHSASEKNLTAIIVNWGTRLIRESSTARATTIAIEGIRILGGKTVFYSLIREAHKEGARLASEKNDFKKSIRTLYKLNKLLPYYHKETIKEIQGYYARWAQYLLKIRNFKDMLYVINSASRKWPSPFLKGFKIHLVSRSALHFFSRGNYGGGMQLYNKNIPFRGESRTASINRQYLYNRWGNMILKDNRFPEAYSVFETALKLYPGSTIFLNGRNRTADLWSAHLFKTKPVIQWINRSRQLYLRYRNGRFLNRMRQIWKKNLQDLYASKKFRTAFQFLDKLRYHGRRIPALLSCDRELIQLITKWTRYTLGKKDFKKTIKIYKKGLIRYPANRLFARALATTYHRYVNSLLEHNRYNEGKKVLLEGLHHFPSHKGLVRIKSYFSDIR